MSPKKKIGKTKRSNRAVNTPTRFKDSASIEGTPHGTPTRGHGSADVDRNTDMEVTKPLTNREKMDTMNSKIDRVITAMTVLSSAICGSENNAVTKILSPRGSNEDAGQTTESVEGRADDEDQNQGSDDENSNNLLLSNGKLKQNLVNGELGEIRKTLNDLKSCVESLTGKKITNHNDSGSDGTGDSDDADSRFRQYDLKFTTLTKKWIRTK